MALAWNQKRWETLTKKKHPADDKLILEKLASKDQKWDKINNLYEV